MFSYLYIFVILFLVVVPGSSFVFVKATILGMFFVFSSVLIMRNKANITSFIGIFFWLCLIFVWGFIGFIANDYKNAARESVAYLVFALLVFFLIVHYRRIDPGKFRITVISSFFLYAVLKFGFIFLVLVGKISPLETFELLSDYASGVAVSGFRKGDLPRIVLANDYLLPVFTAWLLREYKAKRVGRYVFWSVIIVTFALIAITLSRYLYAYVLAILIAYIFLFHKNLILSICVAGGIALAIVGGYLFLETLGYGELLHERFFGGSASSSDTAKVSQIDPLVNLLDSGTLLGHGFGLSMKNTGRGNKQAFQAEVQWLAMTTKIGIIGMSIVLLMLLFYIWKVLINNQNNLTEKIFILIVFGLWLMGGFFNPVLLLTTTAINYLLIYAMYKSDKIFIGQDLPVR